MAKKYYRTEIAGLAVHVAPPDASKGEVAPHKVRFTAYEVKDSFGDVRKYGYLETDNEVAQKKLAKTSEVVELKEADYNEQMKKAKEVEY